MSEITFENDKEAHIHNSFGYMVDDNGRYHAYIDIGHDGPTIYLNWFDTSEDAVKEAIRILAEFNGVSNQANTRGYMNFSEI